MESRNDQGAASANYEIEEDVSLKRMLGGKAGIARIFAKENIEKAQQVIEKARDDFFNTSLQALQQLRERVYASLGPGEVMGMEQLQEVRRFANSLGQQAQALKYPFVSEICKHMEGVCEAAGGISLNYTQLIRDMLDLLKLALQNKLTDNTSAIGQQVMQSLMAVAAKVKES